MRSPDLTPKDARKIIEAAYGELSEIYPESFYNLSAEELVFGYTEFQMGFLFRRRLEKELPKVFRNVGIAAANLQARRGVAVLRGLKSEEVLYRPPSLVGIGLPRCFNLDGFQESKSQALLIVQTANYAVGNFARSKTQAYAAGSLHVIERAEVCRELLQSFDTASGSSLVRPGSVAEFKEGFMRMLDEGAADVSQSLRLLSEVTQLSKHFDLALRAAAISNGYVVDGRFFVTLAETASRPAQRGWGGGL